MKAVGIPAIPFSTISPFASAYSIKYSADLSSLKATSAASHILSLREVKSDVFISIEFTNCFFNLFALCDCADKNENTNSKIVINFCII